MKGPVYLLSQAGQLVLPPKLAGTVTADPCMHADVECAGTIESSGAWSPAPKHICSAPDPHSAPSAQKKKGKIGANGGKGKIAEACAWLWVKQRG